VTIHGQLPAVAESTDYMVDRMKATLEWAEKGALWSTDDYKRKAISSFQQAKDFYEAARNLGIHPSLLRNWKQRIEAENEDTLLTEGERMGMARLRAENRRLKMERDGFEVPFSFCPMPRRLPPGCPKILRKDQ